MTIPFIRAQLRTLLTSGCCVAALVGMRAPAAVGDTAAGSSRSAIVAPASAQGVQNGDPGAKPAATATLEQCLTALVQGERSATFAGEMNAVPGTARMEISIGLLERVPGEGQYRLVSASGLGAWRGSAPGVKTYAYIKQVTNLSAPAIYRGDVRFRWLNARGRVIRAQEMRTPRCAQPLTPVSTETESPPSATNPPSTSTTTTLPSG